MYWREKMNERIVSKEEMLDYICGKQSKKAGYDEIFMMLYYLQGITNDLTKLVERLEDKEKSDGLH